MNTCGGGRGGSAVGTGESQFWRQGRVSCGDRGGLVVWRVSCGEGQFWGGSAVGTGEGQFGRQGKVSCRCMAGSDFINLSPSK